MFRKLTYCLRFVRGYYSKSTIISVCAALFLSVAIGSIYSLHNNYQSDYTSFALRASDNATAISTPSLSKNDIQLYAQIFRAQKAANWAQADEYLAKLSDDILLPDILLERYTHRHYDSTAEEVSLWLKNYSYHPEAYKLVELARHKFPALATKFSAVEKPRRLTGYGDASNEDLRFEDDNHSQLAIWQNGLDAWRKGNKTEAAKLFSELAKQDGELSSWQYAAANFWAHRAQSALGNSASAAKYLAQAAREPRVFYGILARKQLGKSLELDTQKLSISERDMAALLEKSEVRRIIALAQSGQNEKAETAMRQLFPAAEKPEKFALLALANQLRLSAVQISMANQLESDDRQLDALKFPVPKWQPEGGFSIDPALIYALMRQESGFNSSAIGVGGSLGLMQLMPNTAKIMQSAKSKNIGKNTGEHASEPNTNTTLGERYVAHLLNNGLVNGNLFYMLAAYNAGAGRLKDWQEEIDYNDDPLLFVESIPYSTTRFYVLQVMTNYWMYSELYGKRTSSVSALLNNQWPIYKTENIATARK